MEHFRTHARAFPSDERHVRMPDELLTMAAAGIVFNETTQRVITSGCKPTPLVSETSATSTTAERDGINANIQAQTQIIKENNIHNVISTNSTDSQGDITSQKKTATRRSNKIAQKEPECGAIANLNASVQNLLNSSPGATCGFKHEGAFHDAKADTKRTATNTMNDSCDGGSKLMTEEMRKDPLAHYAGLLPMMPAQASVYYVASNTEPITGAIHASVESKLNEDSLARAATPDAGYGGVFHERDHPQAHVSYMHLLTGEIDAKRTKAARDAMPARALEAALRLQLDSLPPNIQSTTIPTSHQSHKGITSFLSYMAKLGRTCLLCENSGEPGTPRRRARHVRCSCLHTAPIRELRDYQISEILAHSGTSFWFCQSMKQGYAHTTHTDCTLFRVVRTTIEVAARPAAQDNEGLCTFTDAHSSLNKVRAHTLTRLILQHGGFGGLNEATTRAAAHIPRTLQRARNAINTQPASRHAHLHPTIRLWLKIQFDLTSETAGGLTATYGIFPTPPIDPAKLWDSEDGWGCNVLITVRETSWATPIPTPPGKSLTLPTLTRICTKAGANTAQGFTTVLIYNNTSQTDLLRCNRAAARSEGVHCATFPPYTVTIGHDAGWGDPANIKDDNRRADYVWTINSDTDGVQEPRYGNPAALPRSGRHLTSQASTYVYVFGTHVNPRTLPTESALHELSWKLTATTPLPPKYYNSGPQWIHSDNKQISLSLRSQSSGYRFEPMAALDRYRGIIATGNERADTITGRVRAERVRRAASTRTALGTERSPLL
jgi:hypothetical protein